MRAEALCSEAFLESTNRHGAGNIASLAGLASSLLSDRTCYIDGILMALRMPLACAASKLDASVSVYWLGSAFCASDGWLALTHHLAAVPKIVEVYWSSSLELSRTDF
jgi:hypothetical protein